MNRFAPSLFDKLLGTVRSRSAHDEEATALSLGIEEVKASIARDIETLLNTRPGYVPEQVLRYAHAAHSLLTFGLPDITSLTLANDRDRHRIVQAISRVLQDHEPRLDDIHVAVREGAPIGAGLYFSIRAKLRLTPSSEPVAFDAVLHPGSNRYAVSHGGRFVACP